MRLPLSWLRDYVDFELEPEQLARRLTARGMEVQGIERVGDTWRSVVVGELLEVAPHPQADRLSLTSVRVDDTSPPLSIVCGATNIHAGQRVPVALPGAVLPGGRQIGISRIQGQESQGMLCSGHELGLTPDADGILILDDGPALGVPLEELVGDVVLDVDVKPNRGDALSLIGLAREVAAITGGRLRWPDMTVPESGDATVDHVGVTVEDRDLVPRFVARYVDGLAVGPSPLRTQLRLSAAGMRPVSNIVDASNYVMLELGKPIHTFDAAAVTGGRIVVRRARDGEQLETLDHVHRRLAPDTLLIADPERPLGIAGVMGGAHSEVGARTSAVIIESAVFDPTSIRRTARRYNLRSEASLRFEKGQESRLAALGADRTARLIVEWAGGRAAVGAIDTDRSLEQPRRVLFRPARLSRLLGEEISGSEMSVLLAQVEIPTEPPAPADRLVVIESGPGTAGADADADATAALVALVPPHRRDIVIEADVAEEVIRLRGYESLAPRLPDTRMPAYRLDPQRFTDTIRDRLSARGLAEVVSNALVSPAQHARLGITGADTATIRVANPVSIDHSELRRSLLPGLVRALVTNERQRRDDVAIFEIGPVHELGDGGPAQADQLAILLSGAWQPASWAEPARPAGVADIKGIVEWLVERIGRRHVSYAQVDILPLVEHPGRTARVSAVRDGREVVLGRVGELHPRYLAESDVRAERACFAILEMAALARLRPGPVHIDSLPRLPAAERDMAVVVAGEVPQASVAAVIRENAGPLLDELTLFDRYEGPPLAADEVSLAYRLRFQPLEQPLAEAELDEAVGRLGHALAERLGARIRGAETTGGAATGAEPSTAEHLRRPAIRDA